MSCSRDPLGRPWEQLSQQSFSQEVALEGFFQMKKLTPSLLVKVPACFESSSESSGPVTTLGRFQSSAVY